MREHVRTLARSSRLPISIVPNAGIPEMVDGQTCYPLDPQGLADAQREFVSELGVSIVGGCCGTTPEHLRAVVEAVEGLTPRRRVLDRPSFAKPGAAGRHVLSGDDVGPTTPRSTVEYRPALASLYAAAPIEQDTSFLVIGERANANGSKAFRELLLDEDWEAMVALAKSQTREGAHVLDVCVDYVGRDGVPDMVEVVDRYATQSTLPLVLDSTEIDVVAGGAGAPRRPRGHQLGQPRGRPSQGRRAAARRQAVRGGGGRAGHRRGGPGPHRRLEGATSASRSPTSRSTSTGSSRRT